MPWAILLLYSCLLGVLMPPPTPPGASAPPRPLPEPTAQAVLDVWFAPGDVLGRWFAVDADFDETLRTRFAGEVNAALTGQRIGWTTTPAGCLALVILVDQFPRNLFRGQAKAFAGDALAASMATRCVEQGFDQQLAWLQRAVLYLPFEHAEDSAVQAQSVALFRQLQAQAPAPYETAAKQFVDAALRHQAVIKRFGRFPARNQALGRQSTAEEADFLRQHPAGL